MTFQELWYQYSQEYTTTRKNEKGIFEPVVPDCIANRHETLACWNEARGNVPRTLQLLHARIGTASPRAACEFHNLPH